MVSWPCWEHAVCVCFHPPESCSHLYSHQFPELVAWWNLPRFQHEDEGEIDSLSNLSSHDIFEKFTQKVKTQLSCAYFTLMTSVNSMLCNKLPRCLCCLNVAEHVLLLDSCLLWLFTTFDLWDSTARWCHYWKETHTQKTWKEPSPTVPTPDTRMRRSTSTSTLKEVILNLITQQT